MIFALFVALSMVNSSFPRVDSYLQKVNFFPLSALGTPASLACPNGTILPDGCLQQNPNALIQHPTFFTGYTGIVYPNPPPSGGATGAWNRPGIDYPVGADATATWDPTTSCPTAGCTVSGGVLTVPDGTPIGSPTSTGYFQVGMRVYFSDSFIHPVSPFYAGKITAYLGHAGSNSTYQLDQTVSPPAAGYRINVIGSGCGYGGGKVTCNATTGVANPDVENFTFNPPSTSGACVPLNLVYSGNVIFKNNTSDNNSAACNAASGSYQITITPQTGGAGTVLFQGNTVNAEGNNQAISAANGTLNLSTLSISVIAAGDGTSTGLLTMDHNAFLGNIARMFQNQSAGLEKIWANYFEGETGSNAHGEWYFDSPNTINNVIQDSGIISFNTNTVTGFSKTLSVGQPITFKNINGTITEPTGTGVSITPNTGGTFGGFYFVCLPSGANYKLSTTIALALAGTCDVTIVGPSTTNGGATYTLLPTTHALYDGYNVYYDPPTELWPNVTAAMTPTIGSNSYFAAWNSIAVTHDIEVARVPTTSNTITIGSVTTADSLVVGTQTYTFVASGATGTQINIGGTPTITTQNAALVLAANDTNFTWYGKNPLNPTFLYYQGTLAGVTVTGSTHVTVRTPNIAMAYLEDWVAPYAGTFTEDHVYRDASGLLVGCVNTSTWTAIPTFSNDQNLKQTAADPNIDNLSCVH